MQSFGFQFVKHVCYLRDAGSQIGLADKLVWFVISCCKSVPSRFVTQISVAPTWS